MTPVPNRTYKLDFESLDRHCAQIGIDRLTLALRVGLEEPLKERVSGQLLGRIVKELGCRPEDVTQGWIVPHWRAMADVLRRSGDARAVRDALRRAHEDDRNGLHDAAVTKCRRLLKRISAKAEPELCFNIRNRMVSFLDNGDRKAEALAEVEALLDDLEQQQLGQDGDEIRIWALVSKGRLLGRMQEFAESREVLEGIRLGHGAPYDISATHQRGVVDLEEYEYAEARGEADRLPGLLASAARYFQDAIRAWSHLNFTYREGFSHRRLAQVHRVRGAYEHALGESLEAIVAFASFDCRRYLAASRHERDETFAEMLRLLGERHAAELAEQDRLARERLDRELEAATDQQSKQLDAALARIQELEAELAARDRAVH